MCMWYEENREQKNKHIHRPAVQYVSLCSCFNVPPGTLESSLLSLLDVSQQLMLILIQTISLMNICIKMNTFFFTETHIHWSPFQSGMRLFSWSDCWWHRSSLLMDQGRNCTKNISVFNDCAIDVTWYINNPAPEHIFLLLQKWLAKQLFQRLCFLSCFVRGRKQLAEVWLCWRHWLSVHAER